MNLDPNLLLARCREERAQNVRPGTEQERAWHAIVPNPELRRVAARAETPVRAPALPPARLGPFSEPETTTNDINPS